MKIIIDLDEIISRNITIEQYYFLSLLYFKRLDLLIEYTDRYGEIEISSVEDLKSKDYLEFSEFKGDVSALKVSTKCSAFLHSMELPNFEEQSTINEQQFEELLATYPDKTNSGRRLKAGVGGVTRGKFMKAYFKNLKLSKYSHEQVIQAIKNEIILRKSNNSTEYWSLLSTYINQGKWESYISKNEVKPVLYGSDFK